MSKIPIPPVTTKDKLRRFRVDWIKENERHNKVLADLYDRLNYMIKEME